MCHVTTCELKVQRHLRFSRQFRSLFSQQRLFFILQNGVKLFKIGTQQPTGDHIQALQRMLATGAVSKPNIVALVLSTMASLFDCWLTLAQGQTL